MSDIESSNPEHNVDMDDKNQKKKKKKQQKTRKTKKVSGVKTKKYLLATGLVIVTGSLVMSVTALAMSNNKQETSAQDAGEIYYTQNDIDKIIEDTIGEIKETIDDLSDAVDEVEEAVGDVKTTIETLETPEGSGSGTETESTPATGFGFGTTSGSVSTKVELMEAALTSLQDSYAGELDSLIDNSTLASEVTAKDVADALNSVEGVSDVTENMVDLSVYDDATGTLTVVVNYGGTNYIIELSGFQTLDAYNQALVDAEIASPTVQVTTAGEVEYGGTPTDKDVSFSAVEGLTFTFVSATAVDDSGSSVVTYTVSAGSASREASQTVTGFQTKAEYDVVQMEAGLTALEDDASALSSLVDGSILPSDVSKPAVVQTLNNVGDITNLTDGDVTLQANDIAGILTVTVSYEGSDYTFDVRGFLTEADYNQALVDAEIASPTVQVTTAGEVEYGGTPTDKDVSFSAVEGLTFTFVSATAVDDSGSSVVTYTVSAGSASREASQTVTGFQTKAEYDVVQMEAGLTALEDDASALGSLVDGSILPSDVSKPAVVQTLNNVGDITNLTDGDVTLQANDIAGILTVTVSYEGSDYTFDVRGFLTEADYNQALVDAEIASPTVQVTTAGEVEYGGTPTDKDVSFSAVEGLTFTFVSATAVDDSGSSVVTYTVSAGSASREASQTVTGFQTKAEYDVVQMEAGLTALEDDASALGSLVDGSILPSDVSKPAVVQTLNNVGDITNLTDGDVTLQANDIAGILTVTVSYEGSDYTFDVRGFLTEADYNQALVDAEIASPTVQVTTAGEVEYGGTPTDKDVSFSAVEGLTFTFVSATAVDDSGSSVVTYTVSAGSASREASQTVTGFQTKAEYDVVQMEAGLTALEDDASALGSLVDGSILPSDVSKPAVVQTLNNVGDITNLTDGDVTLQANDIAGILTVTVSYEGSDYTFDVRGFLTEADYNQALVDAEIASPTVQVTTAGEVEYGGTPTDKDVSFSAVEGLTFTFVSATAVDDSGSSVVTYTVSAGSASREASQTVTGFQTKAEYDVVQMEAGLTALEDDASALSSLVDGSILPSDVSKPAVVQTLNNVGDITNLTDGDVTLQANDIAGILTVTVSYEGSDYTFDVRGFLTEADYNQALVDAEIASPTVQVTTAGEVEYGGTPTDKDVSFSAVEGLTFTFVSATAVDDSGSSVVTYTVSAGSASREASQTVTGFQTKAEYDVVQMEAGLTALEDDASALGSLVDGSILPSDVSKPAVVQTLNNVGDITNLTDGDVTLQANDIAGILTVTVSYEGSDYTFDVRGFLTEADYNQALVDAEIASPTVQVTTAGEVEYGGTPTDKDVSFSAVEGLTFTFVSATAVDDSGSSVVTYTVSAGSASREASQTVTGFQTKAEYDVVQMEAGLTALEDDASALSSLVDGSILPSDVSKPAVVQTLNNVGDITNLTDGDVTLQANDIAGILTVTVSYEGSDYTFDVRGFLTEADYNQALVDAEIASPTVQVTTAGEVEYGGTPTDKDVSFSAVEGLTFTFVSATAVDDSGSSVVTYTVSAGSASREASQTVTGFQTKAEYDVVQMEAGLTALEDDASALSDLTSEGTVLATDVRKKTVVQVLNDLVDISGLTAADVTLTAGDGYLVIIVNYGGNPYSIVVKGFQTTAEHEVALTVAGETIKWLTGGVDTWVLTTSEGENIPVLASAIPEEKVLEVVNKVTGLKLDESHVEIKTDDATGTMTITFTYQEKSQSVTLVGFQTTAQHAAELTEEALTALEGDASALNLVDGSTLPSEVSVKDVVDALNSMDGVSGVTESMVDLSVYDDATGTLTVFVTYESSDYTIVVEGFQTTVERETNKIAKALNDPTALLHVKGDSETKTARFASTSDIAIFDYKTGDTITYEVIGVTPSEETPDGTTVKVTVRISSSVEGVASVIYTCELSGFTSETTVAQRAIGEALQSAPQDQTIVTVVEGAEEKVPSELTPEDFIVTEPSGKTIVSYRVAFVKPAGDDSATVLVEVSSFVEGTGYSYYTITVGGFASETLKAVEAEVFSPAVVISIVSDPGYGSVPTTEDVSFSAVDGLTFTFVSATPVDKSGSSDVTYTVSAGSASQETSQTVFGFQTEAEHDKALIDAEVTSPAVVISIVSDPGYGSVPTTEDVSFSAVDGLTFTFVSATPVDKSGSSDVTYTVSAGSASQETSQTVSGFQTKAEYDVVQMEAGLTALEDDASALSDLTSEGTVLATDVRKKTVVQVLNDLVDISGLTAADVTLTAGDGYLVIIVNYGDKPYVIEVEGFQTTAEHEVALTVAGETIKWLTGGVDTWVLTTSEGENIPVLASAIPEEKVLEVVNKVTGLKLDESHVEIKTDDATGTMTITFTYQEKSQSVTLGGFQTTAQHAAELTEEALTALEGDASALNLVDGSTLPSEVSVKDVVDALNSMDGVSGVTESMVDLSVYDDATGTLTVFVTYESSDYTIVVEGFQTTVERETNKIAKALNDPTALLHVKGDSETKTARFASTSDIAIFDYKTGDTITYEVIGVTPSEETPDGTTVKVTVRISSSVEGVASVIYTCELSGFTSETTVAQRAIGEALQSAPQDQTIVTVVEGAEEKVPSELTPEDFIVTEPSGKTIVSYRVAFVKPAGDDSATVLVEVSSFVEGTGYSYYTITVGGFASETLKAVEAEVFSPAVVISIVSDPGYGSVPTTEDVSFSAVDGLTFTFVSATPVDKSGSSDVTYTVSAGSASQETSQTVFGFQTEAEHDKALIDAEVTSPAVVISIVSDPGYGSVPTTEDVSFSAVDGLTFTFVSATPVDKSGSSDVTYTVSAGSASQETSQTVSGFQTKAEYDVLQMEAGLTALEDDASALSDLTSEGTVLATDVRKKTVVQVLNDLVDISGLTAADVTLTAGDGYLVIIVNYGGKPYVIEVEGFQTTAEHEVALTVAGETIKWLTGGVDTWVLTTSEGENIPVLASAIPEEKVLEVVNKVTGLKLDESHVEIKTDDATGTMTITFTYQEKSQFVTLGGFQTTAQHAAELTEEALTALEGDASALNLVDGSTLPSEVSVKDVVDALNSMDGVSGVTESMVDLSVYDDATGTLTVFVTYESSDYTIVVEGFQTTVERETNKIAKALNDPTALLHVKGDSETKTARFASTSDIAIFDYKTGDTITYEVIGVTPSEETPDGTTVKVTVRISSSVEGVASVIYTCELSGFTSETTVAQRAIGEALQSAPQDQTIVTVVEGAEEKVPSELTPEDFIVTEPSGKTIVSYRVAFVKPVGDDSATVLVEVSSFVEGTGYSYYTITVGGFASETLKAVEAEVFSPAVVISIVSDPGYGSVPTTEDVSFSAVDGLTFTFVSATPVDKSGSSDVTYTVSAGSASQETSQTVFGFQTEAEHDKALIDAEVTSPAVVISIVSDPGYGSVPTTEDVSFSAVDGLTFTFVSATPVDKSGSSDVTYTVSAGSASQETSQTVSGFQTKAEYDVVQMEVALTVLEDDASALSDLTSEGTVLATDVRKKTVVQVLNDLVDISGLTAADVTLTAGDGYLVIIVNYGGNPYSIVVKGFQTTAEHEVALTVAGETIKWLTGGVDTWVLTTSEGENIPVLASAIPEEKVLEVVNKVTGLKLDESHVEIKTDDATGTMTITFTYQEKSQSVTLGGFQTTAQHAAELTEEALTALEGDASALGSLADSGTLPSEVTAKDVADALNSVEGVSDVTENMVDLSVYDDATGTLTVVVNYGGTNYIIELSGFQTLDAYNQALVDAEIASPTVQVTTAGEVEYGGTPTDKDVSFSAVEGLTFTFVSATAVDDSGSSVVTYTVSAGSASREASQTVTGFQTKAEYDVVQMEAGLTALEDDASALSSLVDGSILPSDVSKPAVVQTLNNVGDITNLTDGDVTLQANDIAGILTVTVSYEGSDYTFDVRGFLTEADYNQALVDAEIASPTVQVTTAGEVEYGGTPTDKDVSFSAVEGLTFTFVSATAVDDSGSSVVTYTVSAGSASREASQTVTGFQTKAEYDVVQMEAGLTALEDDASALSSLVDGSILPSDVSKPAVVQTLNNVGDITNLTDGDVTLQANDIAGILTVTVSYEGSDYTFDVRGFLTEADYNQALVDAEIASPTVQVTTAGEVEYGGTPTDKDVSFSAVEGLTFTFVSATAVDDSGSSVVTYTVSAGSASREASQTVTGFQTKAEYDVVQMEAGLTALEDDASALGSLADSGTLPSEVTAKDVADALNSVEGIADPITVSDVTLSPDNEGGRLTITVAYNEGSYTIELGGFQTQAARDIELTEQALTALAADPSTLGSLADSGTLPSEVTAKDVADALNSVEGIADPITVSDVTLSPDNEGGRLTITVAYNEGSYTIELGGFQTEKIYAKSEVAEQVEPKTTTFEREREDKIERGQDKEEQFIVWSKKTWVSYVFSHEEWSREFKKAVSQALLFIPSVTGVTVEVCDYAFYNVTIEEGFALPGNTSAIGDFAFCCATLTVGFELPDMVSELGECAFAYCNLPEGFTLENTNVEVLKNACFIGVFLPSSFELPESLTSIEEYVFKLATLPTGFGLSEGVKTIAVGAFQGAVFKGTFDLSNTQLTVIEESVFYGAMFAGDLVLPQELVCIKKYAFKEAEISGTINISETSLLFVGEGVFCRLKLPQGFCLPESTIYIGQAAFKECSLPNGFVIPSHCEIGANAFKDVQMADDLTWYENDEKQAPDAVPQPGWYISEIEKQ